MGLEELRNYLITRGLKVNGRKNRPVLREFAASENVFKPIRTAVVVEPDLKTEYVTKLTIGDRAIPDPFKIAHGWMNKDESMKFWPIVLYPDISKFLRFFPSELGSKDLNDSEHSKVYSSHKSDGLQTLLYHNLRGSNCCILKGECRKSQLANDTFHKLLIILEKSNKIQLCRCTCMAGMGETCNNVATAMFRALEAIHTGSTKHQFCK